MIINKISMKNSIFDALKKQYHYFKYQLWVESEQRNQFGGTSKNYRIKNQTN
ncbi:hypothetical protein GFK82_00463 [Candidatus Steffania adelgidicola]|nr:hypothetical protein GFK82_00463 [Candidatus Steffania adelgidicola]